MKTPATTTAAFATQNRRGGNGIPNANVGALPATPNSPRRNHRGKLGGCNPHHGGNRIVGVAGNAPTKPHRIGAIPIIGATAFVIIQMNIVETDNYPSLRETQNLNNNQTPRRFI